MNQILETYKKNPLNLGSHIVEAGNNFVTEKDDGWRFTKPDQFPWEALKADNVSWGIGEEREIPKDVLERLYSEKALFSAREDAATLLPLMYGAHAYKKFNSSCVIKLSPKFTGASLLVLHIAKNIEVTITQEITQETGEFIFPRIEILCEPNSKVSFATLEMCGGNVHSLIKTRIILEQDARSEQLHLSLGSKVSRGDISAEMRGKNSEAKMRLLYVADGSRHVDFHTLQDHEAPHCMSDMLCKGVVKDESRAVYYGYINVDEIAQKTDAYQTSRNLLLSPDGRADAIPNLQIKANDVKCSHGASIGNVNADEKFYLMTRGLTPKQAEILLVEGFVSEPLDSFGNKEITEQWKQTLLQRLHHEA